MVSPVKGICLCTIYWKLVGAMIGGSWTPNPALTAPAPAEIALFDVNPKRIINIKLFWH